MGYLNNNLGYRKSLLETRSVIKYGNYAVLTQDGLVKNTIPGFENTDVSILGSPRMGARFVDYIATIHPNGCLTQEFGGNGVQSFVYIIEGELDITIGSDSYHLHSQSYAYIPSDKSFTYINKSKNTTKAFIYKKRYDSCNGTYKTSILVGNKKDLEMVNYEGMSDVNICNFLPPDINFDMNFHILEFDPGASHGYIETHVQEHGALLLSGQGMYNLDNEWYPVESGDYIYMGPYSLQACYAVGRDEKLSYIYSKDCNRDIEI